MKIMKRLLFLPVFLALVLSAEAEYPSMRIMPLGDSITAGTGSTDGNGYRTSLWTMLKTAGYNVDYVGNQTGAASASLGDRDHEGHGGWYLSNPEKGLLEHLDEWFSTIGDPHLVLLLAGTNDTGDGEEGFRNNATNKLVRVLERIRLDQPSAKVIVGTCLNRRNVTRNAWLRDYYNPYVPGIVSAQAAKGQAVTYVDFFGTLDEAADFADEVHPNDAGYEKVAQKWFAAIRAAFPDPSSFAVENDLAVVRAASAATASGVECRLTFNRRMSKLDVENAGKWTFAGNATAPTVVLSADARTAVLTFGADDRSKAVTVAAGGLANETATKTLGFTRNVELAAAPGIDTTWQGADSGDWSVASNWSDGVPVANGTAIFPKDVRVTSAVALSGNLTIWVQTGCTLDLDGVVSGPSDIDLTIGSVESETLAGTVNFNASNTFKGNVRLVNGYARAKADDAFGDPASGEVSVTAANKTTRLYFDGVTSLKPLVQNNVDDGKVSQDFVRFEGVNTIGRWTWNGICRSLLLDGNTRVSWTGGNEGANDLFIPCVFGANGELVVRDRPISGFPYYEANSKGKFVFAVTGNAIVCDVALGMTLRTDVDGAFAANSVIRLNANGRLDLNGHDQCVAAFYGGDGQPYPDGVYVAEGQTGGTVSPQLVGAGRLTVGTPPVENAWSGNGEPGNWNDPANWTVGVPKAGARLTFPQSKVTITSPVVLPGDVTIVVPATGAWTYGELDFEGVISGGEGADLTIGDGTSGSMYGQVRFMASNTFKGSVIIRSGRVHADADNAFGDATQGEVRVVGKQNFAVLTFHGVTSLKNLVTDGTEANFYLVQFAGPGENRIGRWDRIGNVSFILLDANNVTYWTGGGAGSGDLKPALTAEGGALVVTETPVEVSFGFNGLYDKSGSKGVIAFACASNVVHMGTGSVNVSIRCDVDGCFVPESELMLNTEFGGKLDLNGTDQQLSALTVDGNIVAGGCYKAADAAGEAIRADWIAGSGRLRVPVRDVPAVVAVWDAGAGSDTSMLNPLNWAGDALPNFATAAVVADFSQAGSAASFPTDILLKGMKFGNNAFTVNGIGDATLGLYQSGVEIPSGGTSDVHVEVNANVAIMASQVWKGGGKDGAQLRMTGVVTSPMPGDLVVREGFVSLEGVNTFTSTVFVTDGGTLKACGSSPFGESENNVIVYSQADKVSQLAVSGATIRRPVFINGNDSKHPLYSGDSTTSVFEKPIRAEGGNMRVRIFDGTIVFRGGLSSSGDMLLLFESGSSGRFVIEGGRVANSHVYADKTVNLVLSSEGNEFGSESGFWGSGTLLTTVPRALASGSVLGLGGDMTVDLCGQNQEIATLKTANGSAPKIRSEGAATLTVNQSEDRTVSVKFAGPVSLVKKGAGKLTLNAQDEWTGSVVAAEGVLGFVGSWPRGRSTPDFVVFDGAKLEIGSGTAVYANSLSVGNGASAPVEMKSGSYGSSASPAVHKDDVHFSGGGKLVVPGSVSLIFR